jgi:multiple antibiotic resistance protein
VNALDFAASAFITLVVVVEPFGLAPIFLAATRTMAAPARNRTAVRASAYAFTILAGAALVGAPLLSALGISMAAFRIAGGLLLFSIASEMVFGLRIAHEVRDAAQALQENVDDPAAFPLAIPLIAGPGAIAAAILLGGRAHGAPLLLGLLIGAIAAAVLLCWAACLLAGRIETALGESGALVLAKLLGVLLAALAVQFVIDGARAVFLG